MVLSRKIFYVARLQWMKELVYREDCGYITDFFKGFMRDLL